jgi:2-hydroxychromene-2-carboxylate isomerase
MAPVGFYFDLGSPYAYLAAERVEGMFAEPVDWRPISLGAIFKLTGRSSWSLGDPERRAGGIAEVERRASAYGLPAVRWPQPWPGNYLVAMRAATFASGEGLGREFAMSALRAGFREGRDLSLAENVLAVGTAVGLDAKDLSHALAAQEVRQRLREATDAALALGVRGVPTVVVGGELFWGDDRLEEAAAAAGAVAPSGGGPAAAGSRLRD